MPDTRPDQLLTYADAALRLNTSPRTVQRLVASGVLPAIKIGKLTRIVPEVLDSFIATARRA